MIYTYYMASFSQNDVCKMIVCSYGWFFFIAVQYSHFVNIPANSIDGHELLTVWGYYE